MADNRKIWQVSGQSCDGEFTISGQKIFGKLHCCKHDSCSYGDKRDPKECLHGKHVPFFKLKPKDDAGILCCMGEPDGLITLNVLNDYCSAIWKIDCSDWFTSSMIGNDGETIVTKAKNVQEALLMLAANRKEVLVHLLKGGTALLHYMPKEAFDKLSSDDWAEILAAQPDYLPRYLCSSQMSSKYLDNLQFRKLLLSQPTMIQSNAELRSYLANLTNADFLAVFKEKPQLATFFDRYKYFTAAEWKELLLEQFEFFKDNDEAWAALAQDPLVCTELLLACDDKPVIREHLFKRRISTRFTDSMWEKIQQNYPDGMRIWAGMYPTLKNYTAYPNAPEFCRKVWHFPFWMLVFLLLFCGGIVPLMTLNSPGLHWYNILPWITGSGFSIIFATIACSCGINVRGKRLEILISAFLTAVSGTTLAYAFLLFFPFSSGMAVVAAMVLVVGIAGVLCSAFRNNVRLYRVLYLALAMLSASNVFFILNRNADDGLGIARALNRSFWRFPRLRDRYLKNYLNFGQKEKWERACAALNVNSLRESANIWRPQDWDKASLQWWNPDESMRDSAIEAISASSGSLQNGDGLSDTVKTWIELYWELFPANAVLKDPVSAAILALAQNEYARSFEDVKAWLKNSDNSFAQEKLYSAFSERVKNLEKERAEAQKDQLLNKFYQENAAQTLTSVDIRSLRILDSDYDIDTEKLDFIACNVYLRENVEEKETAELFCKLNDAQQSNIFAAYTSQLLPLLWKYQKNYCTANWFNVLEKCTPEQKKEYGPEILSEMKNSSDKKQLLQYLKKHGVIEAEELLDLFAEIVPPSNDWADFLEKKKDNLSKENILRLAEYYLHNGRFAEGYKHIFEQKAFDNESFRELIKRDDYLKFLTNEQVEELRTTNSKELKKAVLDWWRVHNIEFDMDKARFAYEYDSESYWQSLCAVAARESENLRDREKNQIAKYFLDSAPADNKIIDAVKKVFDNSNNTDYLLAMARLGNDDALTYFERLGVEFSGFTQDDKINYIRLKYEKEKVFLPGFELYAENEKSGKAYFDYIEHLAGRTFFPAMTDEETTAMIQYPELAALERKHKNWLKKSAEKGYFKAAVMMTCLEWKNMLLDAELKKYNKQLLQNAKAKLNDGSVKEKNFIDLMLGRFVVFDF